MQDLKADRKSWETVEYSDNAELPDVEDMRQISPDYLPKPGDLVSKKPTRKFTIALDQESIDYFKAEAKRQSVPYQRMIRALLQEYVERAKASAR